MTLGINVEHHVPHVHTQNSLAEALIKWLQLIARTLLMKIKLPVFAWGHAILHAASLVRLRPIATTNTHRYNSCLDISQAFHIYEFLVVLFMYLLHHHNELKWDLNTDCEFTWVLIHHLLLDIWNP